VQPLGDFPAFCGTHRFNAALTRALPWRLDVFDEICFYRQNIVHVHCFLVIFDADVELNDSSRFLASA
jgi:hypothetical protein